ncbi:MAG: MlaD family protein [Bacteroidota bacterium]
MSRQARLGLVVIAALVVGLGFLFIIAGQSNLLARTFPVRATFDQVAGLQRGASVFYNGISVGRVEGVLLPSEPGEPITVRMAIDNGARRLIREDSRALIQTDGLVGNVIVSLTDGSRDRPEVADNGLIQGVEPFALSEVSDRLFTSISRFDSVTVALAGIMTDVQTGEGTLGRFLYDEALYDASVATTAEFQNTLATFTTRADALVAVAEGASQSVEQILSKVNAGDGTVARFLNEDDVYTTFLSTAAQLQEGAAQLQTVSSDIRAITDRFNQAAGFATLGAFRFSENMEALKHSFLFRGYFEDRGYYEMAPFEVRERAIAETLEDLQAWERRLVVQEREIARVLEELERRGISIPEAGGEATAFPTETTTDTAPETPEPMPAPEDD